MTAAVNYVLNISLLETDLDYIITGTLAELLCILVLEKMWLHGITLPFCGSPAAAGRLKSCR